MSSRSTRLSAARLMTVICISVMIMSLAHLHHSRRLQHQNQFVEDAALNDPIHFKQTPPTQSVEDAALNDPIHFKQAPPTQPIPDSAIVTKIETDLATTTAYTNGTKTKVFKPTFYKDATAAKREMGSFLETLKTQSWWARPRSQAVSQDAAEDEDDDEEAKEERRLLAEASKGVYFGYLPMGGGNNQFTSLQKAALLAKDLKRTLILPPISPSSHIKVWSGARYSEFYDLDAFSKQSGIQVLEWHDVKQTPEEPQAQLTHHWTDFSEELPCIPNGGIGVENKNLFDHFRPQFLLNFKAAAPETLLEGDALNGMSTEYTYARDHLLSDPIPQEGDLQQAVAKREMWKCLSCPYFLSGESINDRAWTEVGLHLRFNHRLESMVDEILNKLLGPAPATSTRRHPEFIIVHLRRGDIVNKCKPDQDEKDCLVQIEQIAEKVDGIEKERRLQALHELEVAGSLREDPIVLERLPVLVATNEKRETELEKLEKLGWILLDHGDEDATAETGTASPSRSKKLGTMSRLGPFYPPMIDAALLTRGNYLIGMTKSRMSQLAVQRGAAWHGHTTFLM
ncbi:hypothetical protein BGW38_002371 [Lunasporangiospora selenospora]|uniref:GDP-fucose protein O-fucosyltransferase 2 n=1 Tax=Lunasporangiospora selenospora TaxID=979761 RepID=A0A9P6KDL5_9FUNG|nr:hypothetical protein BGW38_002371 [Lunasporangiospora selenospora]